MFGRVVWFGYGFTAGLAGAWWVKRRVRTQVERYVPERIRDEVSQRSRAAYLDVRAAVAEGAQVMRQFESDATRELEEIRRRHRVPSA